MSEAVFLNRKTDDVPFIAVWQNVPDQLGAAAVYRVIVFAGILLMIADQFLIIGLVSSRDKALDVLAQFDTEIHKRRLEIERERQSQREEAERQSAAALLKKATPVASTESSDCRGDDQPASSG